MNREHRPLAFIGIYVALSVILMIILSILNKYLDFGVEGGPLQTVVFLWFFISIIIFVILGIWALIIGLKLRKAKKDNGWGIANLIIGLIVLIPSFIYLLSIIFSVLMAYINPQYA